MQIVLYELKNTEEELVALSNRKISLRNAIELLRK